MSKSKKSIRKKERKELAKKMAAERQEQCNLLEALQGARCEFEEKYGKRKGRRMFKKWIRQSINRAMHLAEK